MSLWCTLLSMQLRWMAKPPLNSEIDCRRPTTAGILFANRLPEFRVDCKLLLCRCLSKIIWKSSYKVFDNLIWQLDITFILDWIINFKLIFSLVLVSRMKNTIGQSVKLLAGSKKRRMISKRTSLSIWLLKRDSWEVNFPNSRLVILKHKFLIDYDTNSNVIPSSSCYFIQTSHPVISLWFITKLLLKSMRCWTRNFDWFL